MTVLDILNERGFVENQTHDKELTDHFKAGEASCYIGFDPTAPSLHVGSLVPIMSLAHMQRNGHRPIALVGGGTGLVGDPSGKTEMRQLMTVETARENAAGIKRQLSRYIDFSAGNAQVVNNADWLVGLEYIPFLRDIGRFFSVNRMIKAESYRARLESEEGLNFIEFNYMLLQAYDYLKLFDDFGCRVQMGGSDQWGNIVAGIELIRRIRQEEAFGITFPLVTTSSGAKMGKTAKGAIWLDPERTSPYEYYQYWVNTDDRDVERFLCLFTFLPIEEIREVEKLKGAEINNAKEILAFEATKLCHGKEAADKAKRDSRANFGTRVIPNEILPSSKIRRGVFTYQSLSAEIEGSTPHTYYSQKDLEKGIPIFQIFNQVGLAPSASAARRLIEQGGAYINGQRVESTDYMVTLRDATSDEIMLRAGKKKYHKIIISSVNSC